MQRDASQVKKRHGSDFNARGQQVRRVGKPLEDDDALTWSIPEYTTAERDDLPVTTTSFLLIFNSTTSKLNFYDGAAWRVVTST
jgi:hypothetical protein